MVTENQYTSNDKYMGAVTLYGLSTDAKPVSVGNGSCFVEMDTGTISFFDAESSDWIEFDSTGVALPSVTESDNGDVLTVVNGAWDKAAPTGGGVLMIEYDEELGKYNKTYREVKTAFLAGTTVIWCANAIDDLYYPMNGLDGVYLSVNFGGGTLVADSEDGYLYLPD